MRAIADAGLVDVMDRQVELTVVIPLRLRAAPRASVHVCGHTGVEYELGGARVFPAAAKHETLVAGPGDVKLTVIDSVHNEPDALVHVVGREVVDELQVLDVTSCQVAQRACQLGLLRNKLTPLGHPRLVLVLDLQMGAEHLEELIEGR